MAVIKKQFFHHEKGNHDETWYYLARDTETGKVFIIHAWAARADVDELQLSVRELMNDTTSAQGISVQPSMMTGCRASLIGFGFGMKL